MWCVCVVSSVSVRIVDAKFVTSQSLSFSGSKLFVALASGMTATAIVLDLWASRSIVSSASLTAPLVICGILSALAGLGAVPLLRALKAGQIIREDGPKSHLKKTGTPTMGGAFFCSRGYDYVAHFEWLSPQRHSSCSPDYGLCRHRVCRRLGNYPSAIEQRNFSPHQNGLANRLCLCILSLDDDVRTCLDRD